MEFVFHGLTLRSYWFCSNGYTLFHHSLCLKTGEHIIYFEFVVELALETSTSLGKGMIHYKFEKGKMTIPSL